MGSNEPSFAPPRAGRRFTAAVGRKLVASLLCLYVVAGSAHHGPGAYDRSREITVTGSVTRFEFVNPHVLIFIEVSDDQDGETQVRIHGSPATAKFPHF